MSEGSKPHDDPPAVQSELGEGHRLAGLGLLVDWNPAWPILADAGVKRRLIYQPIAATGGIVFVRIAPDDTLDAYLAALGGGRTVTVERDERVTHQSLDARRVLVRLPVGGGEMYTISPGGPEHHHKPLSTDIIVVTGFRVGETSVLAGYRVPADALARHRPVLDAIIDSVRPE